MENRRECGHPHGGEGEGRRGKGGGTCGDGTFSLAAPFYLPVGGPSSMDRARCTVFFFFDSTVLSTITSDTAHETKIGAWGRVTWCIREVCENCAASRNSCTIVLFPLHVLLSLPFNAVVIKGEEGGIRRRRTHRRSGRRTHKLPCY